jgi:LPXTG-site transpeptidase (sortase) family protein
MTPIGEPRMHRATPARVMLGWASNFFFILGVAVLGYVSITLLDARLYQAREACRFEEARRTKNAARPSSGIEHRRASLPQTQPNRAATERLEMIRGSAAWGRIEIKSIGLSSMIMEGVDRETLRRGIGHIPGTALPGQPGNVALAGHRDTFFRALRNIRKNDEITLETLDGYFHYRVDFTQVVAPEYTEALNGSGGAILTLVTCYPFSFVGPAPQRFIVRAHRIPE